MDEDFLKELGHLGITARLKRLSDSISSDIRALYKDQNMDIEPSWHLVFLLLQKYETRTMSEISAAFRMSLPAIFKMISKIEDKGYVEVTRDRQDGRKKQVQLTQKAIDELPKFERIWHAGQKAIQEVLTANREFYDSLEKFEQALQHKDFEKRASENLQIEK